MNDRLRRDLHQRPTLLIADDSPQIQQGLKLLVGELTEFQIVGVAGTGIKTLELLQQFKPDVLILDIRMPEMSGIKVLEALQDQVLDTSIIVLTGQAEEECRRRCLELGARWVLDKCTDFDKLLQILLELARPAAPVAA